MVKEKKSGDTDRVSFSWTAGEITRMVRKKSKGDRHPRKKNIKTTNPHSPAFVAETKAAAKASKPSAPFTSAASTIRSLEHDIDKGTTREECPMAVQFKLQEKSQSHHGSHHAESEKDNEEEDDIDPKSYDMTIVPEREKEAVQRSRRRGFYRYSAYNPLRHLTDQ